jgi:hypothetical protein
LLSNDPAESGNILIMLFKGGSEAVMAIPIANKIIELRLGRMQSCL